MPSKRRLFKKPVLATLLVVVILVAGLAAAAGYIINSRLPQYREQIASRIGERIGAKVRIDDVDLRWNWHGPVLSLAGVRVSWQKPTQMELYLPSVGLQFSLVDLISGQRLPQGVVIHKPHIEFAVDARQWKNLTLPNSGPLGNFDWSRIAHMRDVLDKVAVKNARVDISLRTDTGRRHIHLEQLDVLVHDSDNTISLTASATANQWLNSITLNAHVSGSLRDFDKARVSLDADGLTPLALWHKTSSEQTAKTLSGGTTSLHLDSFWNAGQFDHATARLNIDALHQKQENTTLVPALEARLSARADPSRPTIINVTLESLSGAAPALVPIRASAQIDTAQATVTVRARNIATALFQPLIQQAADNLATAELDGTIEAVEITLTPGKAIQAAIAFNDISIKTDRFAAGPVSGHYYRNGNRNTIRFTDAGGQVRLARYLKGALPIRDLGGQLSWESTKGELQLRANKLKLTSGASIMTLDGTLAIPDKGAPVADLTTHLTTPDCTVLLAHVPQAKDMPFDRLRDWLSKAVDACDVEVDGYLSGPLDQIFAEDGKHLGITITGSGFAMEYKPGWPRLTHATGAIHLKGDTLDIAIDQGQMLGVSVGPINMQVENVREPVLFIDGTVTNGSAPKMLSILSNSPLQDQFGKLATALDVDGVAGLDLDMRLPLKDDLGEIKISGIIHAQDNRINHEALPAPITSVRGDIHFSKKGLSAKELHGELMGVSLTTRITPASETRINIISHGRVALPENKALLDEYLPEQWLEFAHGSTPLEVRLKIDTRGHISGLSLHSDLQGLALTLPKPLGKTVDSRAAFALQVEQGGRVRLDYDHDVHVDMKFDDHRLQRAAISFGAGAAPTMAPAERGIWLGGHIKTLPVGAWLKALNKLGQPENGASTNKPTAPRLIGADVSIDTLRVGNRTLRNIHLNVDRLTAPSGWKIAVNGADAKGKATWLTEPNGRSTMRAHFSRMHIRTSQSTATKGRDQKSQPSKPTDSTLIEIDPALLPALNVTIDRLRIGSTDFGTAQVRATAIKEGWQLDKASLTGGALTLKANGQWTRHVGLTRAQLDIRIEGQGVAQLTRALGFEPAIHAQYVSIDGDLKIAPNDHGLDLAALNGTLSLTLKDGAIRSIEPGAGRLLGLFNLYVLPRRLMLDFSDVVDKGLVFDKISGDFKILSGDAFTDNLVIQAPSAEIRIVGRIGLAARDYDQTVTITPKISSSLTLAGAVLGGPVIGAAIFALQELLETPFEDASSITYQLQGNWGDPKVVAPRTEQFPG